MDTEISHFMTHTISIYESLKGKDKEDMAFQFWDAVVISSHNQGQKVIYEAELLQMKEADRLPLIPFLVISDPPGVKIGNGGSTLHILKELQLLLGDAIFSMRILLIHAGGFSQRLPSCSVGGKLFACLPVGESTGQHLNLLDMQLASYLPLVPHLPVGGVFVCCSDAIITYQLQLSRDRVLREDGEKPSGFLLLAHRSPAIKGTQHGVYVLPAAASMPPRDTVAVHPCLRVLQKPSLSLMHQCNATFLSSEGEEMAYTDSCFFFDSDVTRRLLSFHSKHLSLPCELDAYRDFLQPLGSQHSQDFMSGDTGLRRLQRELWELLADTPAQVLVLYHSHFHHMGTMREYIQALAPDSALLRQLGRPPPEENLTLIQSMVSPASKISPSTVVEHCQLFSPVMTEGANILSQLYLPLTGDTSAVAIPPDCLLHTIPIQWEDGLAFVTVGFGVNDDLKASSADIGSLRYMGMTFDQAGGPDVMACSSYEDLNPQKLPSPSLWTLALFDICSTRESSLLATLTIMHNFLKRFPVQVRPPGCQRASMELCLKLRDITEHIRHKKIHNPKKDF